MKRQNVSREKLIIQFYSEKYHQITTGRQTQTSKGLCNSLLLMCAILSMTHAIIGMGAVWGWIDYLCLADAYVE